MKNLAALKYGQRIFSLSYPEHAEQFDIHRPANRMDKERFRKMLFKRLKSMKPDSSRVALVVSDKTRRCQYPLYLPILLQELKNIGASVESLRIYIAYGTHPPQTEIESLDTYGPVYRQYPFIHHNPDDESLFEDLGITSRGTRIRLRKDILESTLVITFGAISHHYFAGYGGGRKLIFPGLGFLGSIYQNHSLFLDNRQETLCGKCGPGVLKGNPVAEDLDEIEDRFQAHLGIHAIQDEEGRVSDMRMGSGRMEFLKACHLHGQNCEIRCDDVFDLAVASAGGYPRDVNFIQSHKGIENASKFVKNNGRLIFFAQCPDGIGSKTFLPWFESGGFKGAFQRLSKHYEGNGGTALSMMSKTGRISIFMVTDLADSACRKMGVQKISAKEAQEMLENENGTIAVIPNAGVSVRVSSENMT